MKIDILEDDYLFGNNIKEFLELQGYEVDLYHDGAHFLDTNDFKADLYILDVEVPGANGFEVIEWIQNNAPKTPVIFTTAYTDIESITKGYVLGCSDYLKKPFELMELLLHIKKLLPASTQSIVPLDGMYQFDMQSKQLLPHDNTHLSKTQKEILYVLIKHSNQMVSYDLLMDEVWGGDFVKVNTIATHIKEIRKVVPMLKIQSVRAEGYKLTL